jgi:hypothetical protein
MNLKKGMSKVMWVARKVKKLEFFSPNDIKYSQLQNFLLKIKRREICQEY